MVRKKNSKTKAKTKRKGSDCGGRVCKIQQNLRLTIHRIKGIIFLRFFLLMVV